MDESLHAALARVGYVELEEVYRVAQACVYPWEQLEVMQRAIKNGRTRAKSLDDVVFVPCKLAPEARASAEFGVAYAVYVPREIVARYECKVRRTFQDEEI